jgi:hypothetical protein
MELEAIGTLAGLSTVVFLVFEVVKRALRWSPDLLDRFGALVSIGLGLLIGVPVALYLGSDPAQAAINGLFAGLSAMGIYQAAKASPLPIGGA